MKNNLSNTINRFIVSLSSIAFALIVASCGSSKGGGSSSSSDSSIGGSIVLSTIAVGKNHSLIINKSSTLYSFGSNFLGKLGLGDTNDRGTPNQVFTDAMAVAAGESHSLVLKKDGSLLSFGSNAYGQLGVANTDPIFSPVSQEMRNSPTPVPGLNSEVIAISAGNNHSLAIKKDHSLWVFGSNGFGQLGTTLNYGTRNSTPSQVDFFKNNVQTVAAGDGHTLVLTTDGTLYSFGGNDSGQLGRNTNGAPDSAPTKVPGFENDVKLIAAGSNQSFAIKKDGSLYAFGANGDGQLGIDAPDAISSPTLVKNISSIKAIAVGGAHALILKNDGNLLAFGNNQFNQLGVAGTPTKNSSAITVNLNNKKVNEIAAADNISLAKDVDGNVWVFGSQVDIGLNLTATTPTTITLP